RNGDFSEGHPEGTRPLQTSPNGKADRRLAKPCQSYTRSTVSVPEATAVYLILAERSSNPGLISLLIWQNVRGGGLGAVSSPKLNRKKVSWRATLNTIQL